jgi:segregation and condensation protein B
MELQNQIEAILFWKGEPMTLSELCRATKATGSEVKKALLNLRENLNGRGIALIETGEDIALATASSLHEFIERVQKEELSRELSKAALETLSIILYKGPLSRREIEYIRGVNSTAILRSLLIRGMVEREQSEVDERQFLYRGSIELFSLLGITKSSDLPEFEGVRTELHSANLQPVAELSEEGEGTGRSVETGHE